MSLISDALKRQEQLRALGTSAAQREVAATGSPEVAAARPPETSRGSAAPNLAAPAAQPRRASGPTSSRQRPNPFLERERAASRRPNHSVLLMPILGIIVLLVLLFLRREVVPSQPTQVVSRRSKVESPEGPDIVPAETPVDNPADAAVLSDLFPEEAKIQTQVENLGGTGAVPAETPTEVPKAESSMAIDSNRQQSASVEISRTQAAAIETNRLSTLNSQLSTSAAIPSAAVAWPAFTLTGIAVGRERLAILSTGEMLLAGEMSKCGAKVEKVNGASVVFSFGGETKTLRKGEHSDKPADPR